MHDLMEQYKKKVIPAMQAKFGCKNVYAVPRVVKVVVNSGVGKTINARKGGVSAQKEEDLIKDLIDELSLITGQKPEVIRSKKSISGFKLRKGMISGVRATLRGRRMYDFLSRLINIALPRSRDFRGIEEKSVDKSGNLTIGIREQIIFPEIPHDKVRQMWGMEITAVTNTKTRKEGLELFRQLGVPFRRYG